jgi:hypothetical protein
MKKILFILITIILFLLDWAALHDIIKGNEQNYTGEYLILTISILFYAGLVYHFIKKKINAVSS